MNLLIVVIDECCNAETTLTHIINNLQVTKLQNYRAVESQSLRLLSNSCDVNLLTTYTDELYRYDEVAVPILILKNRLKKIIQTINFMIN